MKISKFLTALAIVAPVVGTISTVSCNKPTYITPKIICDENQVTVTCSNIELNKSFTITAQTNDGYKVTSVSVKIAQNTITPAKTSSTTWEVSSSDVTDSSIEISVLTAAESETAKDFIFNRSFSLRTESGGWVCYGTGWILADATPDDKTDYEYYIATNWHVKLGLYDLNPSSIWYGDTPSATKQVVNNYTKFASFSWEPANNFCFESGDTTKAIDFYVLKAKFGSDMPSRIKAKLNNLNTLETITPIASAASSSSSFTSEKIYTGGYPYKSSDGAWRYEEVAPNNTSFYDKSASTHEIDDDGNIVDISPQYGYQPNNIQCINNGTAYDPDWIPIDEQWGMSAGASGSMAVIWEDNKWAVAGIYWGGAYSGNYYSKTGPVYWHPYFSIFNSTYKNFTSQYIK